MIVYVAGYGRSGSTVLDIKLGKAFGFVSLGEVASIYSDLDDQLMSKCGCGKRYGECELWNPLDRMDEKQRRQNRLLLRVYQSPFPLKVLFFLFYLILYQKPPCEYIEEAVTRPLKIAYEKYHDGIFIDSSKTAMFCATRPQLLQKYGFKLAVIHIKRPLKDVLASVKQGDNKYLDGKSQRKKSLRMIRATISYFLSNYYAKRLRKNVPYMLISQLDLKNDENEVFGEIAKFLHQKIEGKYTMYTANHVASGNRLKKVFLPIEIQS